MDIRNYYNFRCTYDQYYKRPDPAAYIDNFGYKYGTSPSKSYYMSKEDFLFSYMYDVDINPDTMNNNVQPIVLNEFQPDVIVYVSKVLSTLVKSGFDKIKQSNGIIGRRCKVYEWSGKDCD